jgi:nickel/cobalt transporter (NiCoT) family protein
MRVPFDKYFGSLRARIFCIYGGLLIFNAGTWLWALIAFRHYPVLLGTAFLAYSFGLRHAVDADHIAAIDNVTRKLMQERKQPVTVGLMFSLGHSTIVFVGSIVIATTAVALQHRMGAFRSLGEVIGTLVSTAFLFGIAFVNLAVLRAVYRVFVRVRNGAPYVEEDLNLLLADRGLLARFFRPLFAMIQQSWHMYPLGLLFGLGFDTATEIGILSISATEASKGLPALSTLVFSALFAAGMSLVDTTDYNMTITLVSVIVALVVGGIEALGLMVSQLHLNGVLWNFVRNLNENFGTLGFYIVGFFILSWILSIGFYRWQGLDELELLEDLDVRA